MVKAVGLLSGGLDSSLAVRIMLDMGIEVYALNLVTPFCTCTRKGCKHEAIKVAKRYNIPIKIIHGGQDYINIIRNPKFGYGSQMNPCLDCRIYLFKKAKEYMEEIGAKFVFTGEVLGQRPMSQHRRAMKLIEKEAGLENLVLRPLSAKLLQPTIPEKMGWVDRDKLLSISGRSRKEQMELATKYNLSDYPCPAGGCRLTDPNFARRVKDCFEHQETTIRDMYLLRYGRHFRLKSGAKVIVGRDEEENKKLLALSEEDDIILEVLDHGSPVTILRGSKKNKDIETAIYLCVRYSDAKDQEIVRLKKIIKGKPSGDTISVKSIDIDFEYFNRI